VKKGSILLVTHLEKYESYFHMARPLRIQFADAWYHVMNRGKSGENIFTDKGDCYAFIDLLIEGNVGCKTT